MPAKRASAPPTPEEFGKFPAWMEDQEDGHAERLAPLILFAVGTGIRLGEVCGLRWSDVDAAAGYLPSGSRHSCRARRSCFSRSRPRPGRTAGCRWPAGCRYGLKSWKVRHGRECLISGEAWANDPDWSSLTRLIPDASPTTSPTNRQKKTRPDLRRDPNGSKFPGNPGLWQMRDSNPRRRCQLIYSQPPLAARVICRTSKEDHPRLQSANRPFPGRSASSNRGQHNNTELPPKNRIGTRRP